MSTADQYRRFSRVDARGSSAIYEDWAEGVSTDAAVLALIDELPPENRHPTLVFASARAAGAPLADWAAMSRWLREHWPATREIALTHATQTNEAARCATLLPPFDAVKGPIALLEVGASAGLCLYPDRYSYDYVTDDGVVSLDPSTGPSPVRLRCALRNAAPPSAIPEVVWRAGIDRHPLDLTDPDDRRWLETLVWPGHEERRRRLVEAAALATSDPVRIVEGDINDQLESLAAEAPTDATLVVFHSAVLLYFSAEERDRFIRLVRSLDGVWIGNEAGGVLPDVDAQLPTPTTADGRFILSVDGVARAITGPHGNSYDGL